MRKTMVALAAMACLPSLLATPAGAVTRDHDALVPAAATPESGAAALPRQPYAGYTSYAALGAVLKEIDRDSERVELVKTGLSANGNPLWLVTVTWPMTKQQRQADRTYRRVLLSRPSWVLSGEWLDPKKGLRPAAFLNMSIHGNETTGVDAGLRLLRRLAFGKGHEIERILKNVIVVIDPVQNPDGRIADARPNGNGFDCNRDFITLTQPETRQTVKALQEWMPVVFLDLHGFVEPLLMDPATVPHNPNLEYDLIIKHCRPLADAERSLVKKKTRLKSQIPYLWGTALSDPATDGSSVNQGWDDYGPYYAPQMAQQYSAVSQTVEAPAKTAQGVAAHFWVCWAALRYTLEHRTSLMTDQATALARGEQGASGAETGRPWAGNMTEMIRPVPWGDPAFPYGNAVGDLTFPHAYIIPVDHGLQKDVLEATRFINHARSYGVKIECARSPFTYGGTEYPAGTYIVPTRQPLRQLVNNLLWDGENVRSRYGVDSMFDVSAWSLPYLWGFDRVKAESPLAAAVSTVSRAQAHRGTVSGDGPVYWFAGDNNWAVRAANTMSARGFAIGMVGRRIAAPFDGIPLGAFVVDTRRGGAAGRGAARRYVRWLARHWGIDLTEADGLAMRQTSQLAKLSGRPSVAVNVGAGTVWVLRQLGFALGQGSVRSSVVGGTSTDDVYINSGFGPRNSVATVRAWMANPKGPARHTYIGIGPSGTGYGASDLEALIPTCVTTGGPDAAGGDNGIVAVDYSQTSVMTAGYPARDYAFAYPPAWYTVSDPAVRVDATYGDGRAGAGAYQQGFWRSPADMTGSVGSAAMLSYDTEANDRVVFTGFHPTYRGWTENTYLLVARAIFLATATPPSVP